jgi:hypothetical protein
MAASLATCRTEELKTGTWVAMEGSQVAREIEWGKDKEYLDDRVFNL